MSSARRLGRGARALLAQPRLLLAVKTALAAGLAWWIAPRVPGVAAEYPYYAPLGAIIAMYPTVRSSVRLGAQSLLGVFLGIVLATVVTMLQTGYPGVLTVAVLAGVGVLVGGVRRLGAGRDWVLTAGLFVLLLGGSSSEEYSIGYIVQVGIGVVVGVLVNLLVVPPLYTGQADDRLRRTRAALADRFDDVAGVFAVRWPLEDHDWETRLEGVPATMRDVREQVRQAEESRSLNPRRIVVRRRDPGAERRDLAALERVSFHLQDLAEVSGILARRIGVQIGLPDALAGSVSRAAAAVAVVVREGLGGDDGGVEAFTAARRAVAELWQAIDDSGAGSATDVSGGVSIAVSLGRTIAALDPDDTTAPRPESEGTPDEDEGEVGGTDSTGAKDDDEAPRDTAPEGDDRSGPDGSGQGRRGQAG
jgi:hypothetical protein